jgi:pyruvate ferredoxin oxidoreductase gamma subunit
VALINHDKPMNLEPDQERELKELNAKLYYLPATTLSLDVAGIDLATNMAMVGAIGAITGLSNMEALEQAVKDRFLGKGFVVSGGTAALDSVVERKFKKKEELIGKNLAVVKAAWDFAVEQGWSKQDKGAVSAAATA